MGEITGNGTKGYEMAVTGRRGNMAFDKTSVCILSMQDVQNMGSLLQSYSLKKMIEHMGYDVFFLDIERREEENRLIADFQSFPDEFQSSKFLARLKRVDRYFINRVLMKSKIKRQNTIYDEFRTNVLNTGQSRKSYDYCVIGSDEVFNCLQESPWGFTSQLFGDVKEAEHVITYAACCGATTVDKIPSDARKCICAAMDHLEAISVRDANTRMFVKEISGKEAEEHLDPVLIGDFDKEMEEHKNISSYPTRYCVIYAYYNRIHKAEEIEAIRIFCKKHDLVPIAVGSPQMWIKNYMTATPFQCLNLFKAADFVITDTFHGTIFSAKYSPRFASVVRGSNRNKLQDLINRIDISDHQISSISVDELERVYSRIHDKDRFNVLIRKERERTLSYLSDNLK